MSSTVSGNGDICQSDHVRRLREEYVELKQRPKLGLATAKYREGLRALVDECRNRLGFPNPEADVDDESTYH